MASTVLLRWHARRAVRVHLLKGARARLAAAKRRHAGGAELRDLKARVAQRLEQVHAADRIIARHRNDGRATHTSPRGVAFIGAFEGFRSAPYRDAVGVWTIGYGHTAGVSEKSRPLTRQQAADLLSRELDEVYEPAVRALPSFLSLKQSEFDALVSLAYNLGTGILGKTHTIGAALAKGDRAAAGEAFLLYDQAGGKRLAGLTRRRRAERLMFLDGKYS